MSTVTDEGGFLRSAELRATNPLFGPSRLKLGVFGINSVGCAQTLAPEAFEPSWARSLSVVQQAEEAGIDVVVPYARWKSFVPDDPHHRSSRVMECFAWSAAVAASTSRIAVFATCHVPVFHPVVAAKQASTIDQISGGRFGLNIVAGWYQPELDMFGIDLPAHDKRYAQAAEWTSVLKAMWCEEDPIDCTGEFYKVRGGHVVPRPAQAPRPPIMNAGSSERGRLFAAQYADLAFAMFGEDDLDGISAQVSAYKNLARAQFRRSIQVWSPAYVVHGTTEAAATAELERLVRLGDYRAANAFIDGMVQTSSNLPEPVLRQIRHRIVEGGGGIPLVGTTEMIVDRMTQLSNAGVDGLLLSWVDYEEGIEHLSSELLPALADVGIRVSQR